MALVPSSNELVKYKFFAKLNLGYLCKQQIIQWFIEKLYYWRKLDSEAICTADMLLGNIKLRFESMIFSLISQYIFSNIIRTEITDTHLDTWVNVIDKQFVLHKLTNTPITVKAEFTGEIDVWHKYIFRLEDEPLRICSDESDLGNNPYQNLFVVPLLLLSGPLIRPFII
jgi:hypothetical protein